MKRMMRDVLVDRLKAPIYESVGALIDAGPWVTSDAPFVADAVLAALGLDDLDAAVERVGRAIHDTTEKDADRTFPPYEEYAGDWNTQAREVLAALFATAEGQPYTSTGNTDGDNDE